MKKSKYKSEEKSLVFKGYTHKNLVSKAWQTIEWVTDEYKDDIHGRYWLNVYHGAGVYELIIQKGRIVGSIFEGFYPTIPQEDGHNAITRNQWIEVLTKVINERLGDNWHFAKADGSCTHFFLREYPEDEELRSYVKMYMVPSRQYTGWHTNYEITASRQEHNDHPLLAFVEVQWPDIWYVKCPQCGETLISGCSDLPIPNWTRCKCSKAKIYISQNPL